MSHNDIIQPPHCSTAHVHVQCTMYVHHHLLMVSVLIRRGIAASASNHTHAHVCVRVCVYTCTCMYIYAHHTNQPPYTNTCTYIIHTYVCVRMCTQKSEHGCNSRANYGGRHPRYPGLARTPPWQLTIQRTRDAGQTQHRWTDSDWTKPTSPYMYLQGTATPTSAIRTYM